MRFELKNDGLCGGVSSQTDASEGKRAQNHPQAHKVSIYMQTRCVICSAKYIIIKQECTRRHCSWDLWRKLWSGLLAVGVAFLVSSCIITTFIPYKILQRMFTVKNYVM